MKVKIEVEFEVTTELDEEEHGELDEALAKSAALEAAYQHLTFTESGASPADQVNAWAYTFGWCQVRLVKQ